MRPLNNNVHLPANPPQLSIKLRSGKQLTMPSVKKVKSEPFHFKPAPYVPKVPSDYSLQNHLLPLFPYEINRALENVQPDHWIQRLTSVEPTYDGDKDYTLLFKQVTVPRYENLTSVFRIITEKTAFRKYPPVKKFLDDIINFLATVNRDTSFNWKAQENYYKAIKLLDEDSELNPDKDGIGLDAGLEVGLDTYSSSEDEAEVEPNTDSLVGSLPSNSEKMADSVAAAKGTDGVKDTTFSLAKRIRDYFEKNFKFKLSFLHKYA